MMVIMLMEMAVQIYAKLSLFYLCSAQPSVCTWSCGDSIYQPETGEQCDNGNSTVIDGCSDTCEV